MQTPKNKSHKIQRSVAKEAEFYRKMLIVISDQPRKTLAVRIARSSILFWDTLQAEVAKKRKTQASDAPKRSGGKRRKANVKLNNGGE